MANDWDELLEYEYEEEYERDEENSSMELSFKLGSDKPLEFAVKQLGKINKKDYHNAIYGGINPDNGATKYYEWGCHAQMRNMPQGSKLIWSAWMPGDTGAASDAFFDWITSDESPWAEALKMGMSFSEKKYFDRKFWKANGFIFDRLDKIPSNVLQNFLIASRIPKEHPTIAREWYHHVRGGLTSEMALVMASNFQGNNVRASDNGDYPLYAVTGYDKYIRNFCAHKMDKSVFNAPYFETHTYTPVNRIWGPFEGVPLKGKDKETDGLQYGVRYNSGGGINVENCVLGQYAKDIGKYEERMSFSTKYTMWSVTPSDVIKIGKEEEKRLKL